MGGFRIHFLAAALRPFVSACPLIGSGSVFTLIVPPSPGVAQQPDSWFPNRIGLPFSFCGQRFPFLLFSPLVRKSAPSSDGEPQARRNADADHPPLQVSFFKPTSLLRILSGSHVIVLYSDES